MRTTYPQALVQRRRSARMFSSSNSEWCRIWRSSNFRLLVCEEQSRRSLQERASNRHHQIRLLACQVTGFGVCLCRRTPFRSQRRRCVGRVRSLLLHLHLNQPGTVNP